MTVRNAERAVIGGTGASPGPRARLARRRGMPGRRGVPDRRDWRRWLPTAVLGAGTVAGTVLFFAPLGRVTAALGRMNGLGLISIMPPAALAGIALLALTFVAALGLSRAQAAAAGSHPGGHRGVPGRDHVRRRAGATVPHGLLDRRFRRLHRPDRAHRPGAVRLLQLARLLLSGRAGRARGRQQQPDSGPAFLAAGGGPAVPRADGHDSQPDAGELAGQVVRGVHLLRRQLGRPGLLFPPVAELPAVPVVHRPAADLLRPDRPRGPHRPVRPVRPAGHRR